MHKMNSPMTTQMKSLTRWPNLLLYQTQEHECASVIGPPIESQVSVIRSAYESQSEFPIKKFPNFILRNTEKQITLSERTGKENSFEWSHRRVRVSLAKPAEPALFVRVFRANEVRSGRRARDTRDGGRCGKFLSVPSLSHVSGDLRSLYACLWSPEEREKLTPPCSTGYIHSASNPNPDLSFDRLRVLGLRKNTGCFVVYLKTNNSSWFSLEMERMSVDFKVQCLIFI